MPESPSLSVVVPIYNGAATIDLLVERLTTALRSDGRPFEIILVNDGSHDDSWTCIEALAQRLDVVRGIDLMRNYGQHNALLCGIRAARHEFVVTMDDDLQHPPEEISRLLDKADDGFDVVYGVLARERHGWLRALASRCTKLALKHTMEVQSATDSSAFRLFRTVLRNAFAGYESPFLSIDVLLSWSTTRFGSVAVRHDPRHAGTSGYRLRTLVRHGFNMLTGYSALPLQMATLIGFTCAAFGVGVAVYVLANYFLRGGGVPGFTFLAAIIAIFAGAQLFALGIIGEYLARMHFRVMNRPAYTVRATTTD